MHKQDDTPMLPPALRNEDGSTPLGRSILETTSTDILFSKGVPQPYVLHPTGFILVEPSQHTDPTDPTTLRNRMRERRTRARLLPPVDSLGTCQPSPILLPGPGQTPFFALADLTKKYGRVFKQLQTLRHHKSTGTFPPQIQAIHEPTFQYCKEYDWNLESRKMLFEMP